MKQIMVCLLVMALVLPGCNDGSNKEDCLDLDGDGYGLGATCAGLDCTEADDTCWAGACCDPLDCTDADGDGYGQGADCAGPDCDEGDDACWQGACCDPLDCIDGDGDGYGQGADCAGPDCDDADDQCFQGACCEPCAGVTCSDHGTCVLVNDLATCQCDQGYHPEGLDCVVDVVSNPYVPTHFVAPYESVTNASSDTDAVNGTAFADATDPGSPCTLGEAMAEAQAGDVVQVAPGVYTGEHAGDRWTPVFAPAHSGSAGNPIVFYAQNPAAYNLAGRSELRHTGTAGPVLGPVLGDTDGSDVILDGFYIDSSQNPIGASGGTVQLHRATRCEYRRMYFDQNTEWGTGDNFNMIFAQADYDCVVSDCVFQSTGSYTDDHNLATIEFYDSENLTIQYCEFRDVGNGVFAKGEYPAVPGSNSAVIRYNLFTGCTGNAIELGTSDSDVGNSAYQNLSYGNRDRGGALHFENSGHGYKNNKFFNNTVQGGLSVRAVDGQFDGGNQLYNNIIFDGTLPADQGGDDLEVVHDYGVVSYNNPYDYFEIADYNLFWRSDGGPVQVGGNDALFDSEISFTQWLIDLANAGIPAATTQSNSIEADPQFEDLANDDYRLANNGQTALTASSTGGPVGCYITGAEEIGLRADPTY